LEKQNYQQQSLDGVLFLPITDVEENSVTGFVPADIVQDGTGAEEANFIEELSNADTTLSQEETEDAGE